MTMITQREFEEQMKVITKEATDYPDKANILGVQLMIDVLKQFGYDSGINVFTKAIPVYRVNIGGNHD